MVIQRWQSVWLLVAAICVATFCFLPMALMASDQPVADSITFISPADNAVVLIVGLVVALLLLLNIFSFKNTRLQKQMTILAIVLMLVLGCCASLMVYGSQTEDARVEWLGSIFLLLGGVVFAILAFRGIRHDEKLLKAADRLR